MADFVNSISELKEISSDKEKLRVWNQVIGLERLRFQAGGSGTSDGAGTWLTLWSGTLPTDASVGLRAQVIGRGSSAGNGVLFEIFAALQNYAGAVTYTGGTFSVIVNLTDNALFDVRWAVSGTTVSLQVNDGAVQALNWRAYIEGVTTV